MKPTIGHGNPWPEQATVAWIRKDDSSSSSGNDDSKANDPMNILVVFSTMFNLYPGSLRKRCNLIIIFFQMG